MLFFLFTICSLVLTGEGRRLVDIGEGSGDDDDGSKTNKWWCWLYSSVLECEGVRDDLMKLAFEGVGNDTT